MLQLIRRILNWRVGLGLAVCIVLGTSLAPTFQFLGELAFRRAQLAFIGDDWRGDPPYRARLLKGKERIGTATKIASLQFPDTESCLVNSSEALSRKDLNIDWERIDNSRQAGVCIFRVLHDMPDIPSAAAWFRSQGFSARDTPFKVDRRDPVNLRLDAGWSIGRNGPRFESPRFFTRFLPEFSHSFTVRTSWDETGRELLFLETGFPIK